MTTTQWLKRFQAGAGRLPGWHLRHGQVRLEDAMGLLCCPLRAQWNLEHPGRLILSNTGTFLESAWAHILTCADVTRLISWADRSATGHAPPSQAFLAGRNRLLQACRLPLERP